MVFCNYVGWSKLVFINTILCKPTLINDYMNMNKLDFSAMKLLHRMIFVLLILENFIGNATPLVFEI